MLEWSVLQISVKNFERTLSNATTKLNLCFVRLMISRSNLNWTIDSSPHWSLKTLYGLRRDQFRTFLATPAIDLRILSIISRMSFEIIIR